MTYLMNTLTPSFSTPNSFMTNNLANAWNNVPVGTFNMDCINGQCFPYPTQTQTTQKGSTVESNQTVKKERLVGEDLVSARVDAEEYPVTETHMAQAEELVYVAKDILSKDGDDISSQEWSTLDKIFNEVNKNPMLAEAFVNASNDIEFEKENDNTTTLLGCYESALIEKYNDWGNGKDASDAQAKVSKIKADFKKNVADRNEDVWSDFDNAHNIDQGNTTDSLIDRIKVGQDGGAIRTTAGIVGGAAAVAGGAALIAGTNFWNPIGWGALVVAGVAGVVASVQGK